MDMDSNLETGQASVLFTLDRHQAAMANVSQQYLTDDFSKSNLIDVLEILYTTHQKGGKIVLCGIGKSFKIANKLVATLNSLSIPSQPLHPSEALHGDLGLINEDIDCMIMVTASGNTPELLQLLPHISPELPIALLTCSRDSKLATHPMINALLYVNLPPHLNEDSIHGLPAPTVSTTLSLVLADAAILALSEMIEEDVLKRKSQFSKKHPGGSIGLNLSHLNDNHMKMSSQGSAASLFSLSQLSPKNGEDSSVSSDDDLLMVKPRLSGSVLTVPRADVMAMASGDRNKLVDWMALYDCMVTTGANGTNHAVAMAHVRKIYREQYSEGGESEDTWQNFKLKLMLALEPI